MPDIYTKLFPVLILKIDSNEHSAKSTFLSCSGMDWNGWKNEAMFKQISAEKEKCFVFTLKKSYTFRLYKLFKCKTRYLIGTGVCLFYLPFVFRFHLGRIDTNYRSCDSEILLCSGMTWVTQQSNFWINNNKVESNVLCYFLLNLMSKRINKWSHCILFFWKCLRWIQK